MSYEAAVMVVVAVDGGRGGRGVGGGVGVVFAAVKPFDEKQNEKKNIHKLTFRLCGDSNRPFWCAYMSYVSIYCTQRKV